MPKLACAVSKKKSWKSISLEVKYDVLRHFDTGECGVNIARVLGLLVTLVRIHDNAKKVR